MGYFDTATGEFISGENYQGSEQPTAPGARAVVGDFQPVDMAKTTGLQNILAGRQEVADYFIANLPADGIPYWDSTIPTSPPPFRDTSAAAIAADGLIQLSTLVADKSLATKYRNTRERILTSLSSRAYLAEGTINRGLLVHGAQNVPNDAKGNDVSLIFGDYFFLMRSTGIAA